MAVGLDIGVLVGAGTTVGVTESCALVSVAFRVGVAASLRALLAARPAPKTRISGVAFCKSTGEDD